MNFHVQNLLIQMSRNTLIGIVLQCVLTGVLFAHNLEGQQLREVKVNIQAHDITLEEALTLIEKQTQFKFSYVRSQIPLNKKVTLTTNHQDLEVLLQDIAREANVSFKRVNNQIGVKKNPVVQAVVDEEVQQDRLITGTVIETGSKEPLVGATVLVKGTSIGTITDLDGNFKLSVPAGKEQLVVSSVGYEIKEITLGSQDKITVTLSVAVKALEEVVVIGYGVQQKADLTGAVSSVKIEEIENTPATGINHALQGRMPGVTVYRNSGAPGSSASIRIRGIGTFGNTDPLYVVDGMPIENLNDINPNNIERIDVLKDAAASAIYGSRAANGVVLINTKSGSKEGKLNVAFNTYHGIQQPSKKLEVLNAEQRNLIHAEAYLNDGKTVPDYYSDPQNAITRTDWQDEIFNNAAYIGNYDVQINGGDEKAQYSFMVGHFKNEGLLTNTDYQRTTVRLNTTFNLSKNLQVGENLLISTNKNTMVNTVSDFTGALVSALLYQPDVPVYANPATGELSGAALGADIQNPVGLVNRYDRTNRRNRVFGNAFIKWDITPDVELKTSLGYDWADHKHKWFVPSVPEEGRKTSYNELNQSVRESQRWISTTTAKFQKTFGKHEVEALAGMSMEEFQSTNVDVRVSGFISEGGDARYLNAATALNWATGGREEWGLLSYFGRLNYSFDDKYLFSVNLRTDGSSKFSKDNRWGVFPSVSAGWRISSEPFFEPVQFVSNLKIRGSYGQLGNQNIWNNYPMYTRVRNTSDNDGYKVVFGEGGDAQIGRYEDGIINKDLKWEVTTQTDFGLDLGLFDDRIEITADYYLKKSTGVLLQVPITSLPGVSTAPFVNGADVENKGFEFSLGYHKREGDFKYNVTGNFSIVKNEVLSMGAGNEAIYSSSYRGKSISRTVVGEPIAHFFGYKTDGLFQSQEEVDNYTNSEGALLQKDAKPGDIKFKDINNDGIINADDRTYIGDGFPDFTYGLNFNAEYRNFDFTVFFQGVGGYQVLNTLKYTGLFVDPRYNQFEDILDRWTANNPGASVPRVTADDKNGNQRISDFFVEDANYLRLKNLTVGYTFSNLLLSKIGAKKVRVYLTAENLLTFTEYKGYDPEIGESYPENFGITELGVDRGQYPQPRTFIIGANFKF
ncbi:TonB-dependent receptor [Rapidithrix thailandica]|uniref:TonB-dependent receptor n=1 Tax=Rapidithrix thailandica TaxID=413964 RepID=A0AAW9S8V7_9BACT